MSLDEDGWCLRPPESRSEPPLRPETSANAECDARACGDRISASLQARVGIALVQPQADASSFDEKVWFERNERVAVQVFSNRVILFRTPRAPVGDAGCECLSGMRGLVGRLNLRCEPALRRGKFRWHCLTSRPTSQRASQTADRRVEETFSSAITNRFRANTLTGQLAERATRAPEQERRRFQ
jgi:hypothetical protein